MNIGSVCVSTEIKTVTGSKMLSRRSGGHILTDTAFEALVDRLGCNMKQLIVISQGMDMHGAGLRRLQEQIDKTTLRGKRMSYLTTLGQAFKEEVGRSFPNKAHTAFRGH